MSSAKKQLTVAIAGNPNCGKTTIFNGLTGAHQHVGNWGGVTVDIKEGVYKKGEYEITFVDLPGTYSMSAFSIEEKVARNYIVKEHPDVVVQVVDSTNLERNLYLTVQLLEMGIRPVLALNMWDEAIENGVHVDLVQLEKLLGVPVVTTVGRREIGIDSLAEKVIAQNGNGYDASVFPNFTKEVEEHRMALADLLRKETGLREFSPEWLAVKLLEDDIDARQQINELENGDVILNALVQAQHDILALAHDEADCLISEARYGYTSGVVRETVRVDSVKRRVDMSDKIDSILTHKFWAYPIFGLFLFLLFQLTFSLGEYPKMVIDAGFSLLSTLATTYIPEGWVQSLIVDGVLAGVGGVAGFLPNILILFLGISIMEDTGYMARAAFIMDKFMHKIGLHGKSFIPMIMGIGCTVPAVMAARTLESEKDRIKTILLTPLISCSARLPVFILFAGALFPKHAGIVVFLFHVIFGFLSFAAMALVFKHSILKKKEDIPFVMELPPYRMPTRKSVVIHMWQKAEHYLVKMGTTILVFSVVLWFAQEYPKSPLIEEAYAQKIAVVQQNDALTDSAKSVQIAELRFEELSETKKATYIGQFGQILEPIVAPFGTDWKGAVALATGFVAKEVVVSSMGVLYSVGDDVTEEDTSLQQQISKNFTPLAGFAFMWFVLLYTPCIVALTTIIRELDNWKWSLFSVTYQISLAWLVATVVFQVGRLLGF